MSKKRIFAKSSRSQWVKIWVKSFISTLATNYKICLIFMLFKVNVFCGIESDQWVILYFSQRFIYTCTEYEFSFRDNIWSWWCDQPCMWQWLQCSKRERFILLLSSSFVWKIRDNQKFTNEWFFSSVWSWSVFWKKR